MKTVSIQATSVALTPEEIESAIPAGVVSEIKKKDPRPLFQAYSIVQEGISRPRVIGEGQKAISWPRAAVASLVGKVKKGLQFFIGHNADSSHAGRTAVGEVVADFQQVIKGVLNHIVIGYFPDKATARDCDVCSIEADVTLRETATSIVADMVETVTGIALANSSKEKPAFAGAKRLGMLQAFDEPGAGDNQTRSKHMTLSEIQQAVKDLNIWPHQLYNEKVYRADPELGKVFADAERLALENKTLADQIKAKDVEIKTISRKAETVNARDRLVAKLPTGLTEKQKEFITKKFDPEKVEDLSDTGIDNFISQGQKDFAEMAKLFVQDQQGGQSNNSTGGDGAGNDVDPVALMTDAIINPK
jgi:hypothetical protein